MPLVEKPSHIRKFYDGKILLITGATGYIGKLLLEKCLRSLNVKRIYIVVRTKKGRDPSIRLKNLLECPIFDSLKASSPGFSEKISLLSGDLQYPNLGLSDDDVQEITSNVNCVFHCAATVNFDEVISLATKINILATRDLIRIAKKMPNLQSYVHVSTAYSNVIRNEIDEVIYESQMHPDKLYALFDALDDGTIEDWQDKIIGDFPNTYSFTKNISEYVVKLEGVGLPISIIRPSIVMGTEKEPVPGFVDNYMGVSGLAIAVACGFVRTVCWKRDIVLDVIPADYVVNETIAVGWENFRKSKSIHQANHLTIYNCVTGEDNPIHLGYLYDLLAFYNTKIGTKRGIWYPFLVNASNITILKIYAFFLHLLPYYIIDFVRMCLGKKPFLIKLYERYEKLQKALTFFMTQEWYFHSKNTKKLYNTMSERDRELFYFDVSGINWIHYMKKNVIGLKKYLMQEEDDGHEDIVRRMRKLKYLHLSTIFLIITFFYYFLKFVIRLYI